MTNKTAAHRYARALFDVARREGADLDRIDQELALFTRLFAEHAQLERVLLNPAVPVQRKQAAVAELSARAGTSAIVSRLMALLAGRDRLILLPDLLSSYRDLVLDYRKIVRAEVTTAMPLAPDQMQMLETRLATVTGRTMLLQTRVDPSIIGGLVAKVGSTVYDASITRQLQNMRERLVG